MEAPGIHWSSLKSPALTSTEKGTTVCDFQRTQCFDPGVHLDIGVAVGDEPSYSWILQGFIQREKRQNEVSEETLHFDIEQIRLGRREERGKEGACSMVLLSFHCALPLFG